MPYSQFTLSKVKRDFGLAVLEEGRFLPDIEPIEPGPMLEGWLEQTLSWAIAVDSEKARSETIITPVLLEVRRQLDNKISVFSGKEFNVDPDRGLNGYCDYLISQSPEQLDIEAPVVVVVEAKKGSLNDGLGQAIATMYAANLFNENQDRSSAVFGVVSSGTAWRFLKLSGDSVSIEMVDYPLQPVGKILSILRWMAIGK